MGSDATPRLTASAYIRGSPLESALTAPPVAVAWPWLPYHLAHAALTR